MNPRSCPARKSGSGDLSRRLLPALFRYTAAGYAAKNNKATFAAKC
jgi:hypothetical protein